MAKWIHLLCLALVATAYETSEAQSVGRYRPYPPYSRYDPYFYEDFNAYLLMAKAAEASYPPDYGYNNINVGDLINKLLNALLHVTFAQSGTGVPDSNVGTCGTVAEKPPECVPTTCSTVSTGSETTTTTTTTTDSSTDPLINLQLLNGDLLRLLLGNLDLLNVDLGKGGEGGSVTELVTELI